MILPRKSFSIHSDYYSELCNLTAEQRGDVLLALINWANDGEPLDNLDPICGMLFRLMKAQAERISLANSANGSKGGRGNKSEKSQKSDENGKSEESEKNGQKPKKATVSVTDTVTDTKENPPLPPKGGKSRKAEIQEIWDSYIFSPLVSAALKSWGKYKREKRQEYKPEGLKSLFSQVQHNVEKYGEDAVIALIGESMAANWQGIAWDKLPKREGVNNATNRGSDQTSGVPPGGASGTRPTLGTVLE